MRSWYSNEDSHAFYMLTWLLLAPLEFQGVYKLYVCADCNMQFYLMKILFFLICDIQILKFLHYIYMYHTNEPTKCICNVTFKIFFISSSESSKLWQCVVSVFRGCGTMPLDKWILTIQDWSLILESNLTNLCWTHRYNDLQQYVSALLTIARHNL